jgi:hypothetical protein
VGLELGPPSLMITIQHPSVISGAKPGVEVGNRNTYKLIN